MTTQELVVALADCIDPDRGDGPEWDVLKAVALVEEWGEERWQQGYDLGWKHCEDQKKWDHVRRNL